MLQCREPFASLMVGAAHWLGRRCHSCGFNAKAPGKNPFIGEIVKKSDERRRRFKYLKGSCELRACEGGISFMNPIMISILSLASLASGLCEPFLIRGCVFMPGSANVGGDGPPPPVPFQFASIGVFPSAINSGCLFVQKNTLGLALASYFSRLMCR